MKKNEEFPSLHNLTDQAAQTLCEQLRFRLLESVSTTGGHLASNLGVVELTVALHRVFDTETDRLLFDVGHQCYIHKILTGRNAQMETIRQFGGLAGFPKPSESAHDAFIAGHASAAVSAALGMALARTQQGAKYHVLALLGDGAMTGGLAYEGLSTAGQSGEPLIVILNDNGMSITKNISGVAKHLARQRLKPQYFRLKRWYRKVMGATALGRAFYRFTHHMKAGIKAALLPGSFFEDMGFQYMGPIDGHDVAALTRVLQQASEIQGPVLLHVKTIKGNGYPPAERNPDAFHGIAPFHKETGNPRSPAGAESFSATFGETLCTLAQEDPRIFAITAAMEPGTGLGHFAKMNPTRFFDVGIAEGHAVTMAAGMAKQGLLPVFAVYSTFLQRSYDMLLHDVSILKLPVLLCIDRAGLVGDDGETHHGVFDLAFLRTVPHMTVLAPASRAELASMLRRTLKDLTAPVAIRYPRGDEGAYQEDHSAQPTLCLQAGTTLTLVSYGIMINTALEACDQLAQQGISVELIKLNRPIPLDGALIAASVQKTGRLLVLEDVAARGCIGELILADLLRRTVSPKGILLCNCGEAFVPHGNNVQLYKLCGLDIETIVKKGRELCCDG